MLGVEKRSVANAVAAFLAVCPLPQSQEARDELRAQGYEVIVLIALAHSSALFFGDCKNFDRRIGPPGDCPAHYRAQILHQPAARALRQDTDRKAAFERHSQ